MTDEQYLQALLEKQKTMIDEFSKLTNEANSIKEQVIKLQGAIEFIQSKLAQEQEKSSETTPTED